jgi:5-methylcytosine-specific restriction endonuclease McrA
MKKRPKAFSCDLCPFSTIEKDQIVQHMQKEHLKSNLMQCDYCTANFDSLSSLIFHKNKHHNFNNTQFNCQFCLHRFDNKEDLVAHRKKHYAEKAANRKKMMEVGLKKRSK